MAQRPLLGAVSSHSILDPTAAYFDIPANFRRIDCVVARNTLRLRKLRRRTIEREASWRLAMEYPPVGSEWKDRDLRVQRTVRVVRYDVERRRVRIHCIETDILSWAKPERFNGKSGGYSKIEPVRGKR